MSFHNCIVHVLLALLLVGCHGDTGTSRVTRAFIKAGLTPNIVTEAPNLFLGVNYTSVNVDLGTVVNPLQTLAQPVISFEANSSELYTFMFFGPDLPIDVTPRYTQFLHWLIVNIPGHDMERGDTLSSHFPPTPYPGGFPYLFLLYKQNNRIDSNLPKSLSFILNRPGFDPVKFKMQHNLTGPISGNFMREAYLNLSREQIQGVLSSITSSL